MACLGFLWRGEPASRQRHWRVPGLPAAQTNSTDADSDNQQNSKVGPGWEHPVPMLPGQSLRSRSRDGAWL